MALAVALAAGGCGGSGGSGGALHDAGARLGAVHSGNLVLKLTAAPGTTGSGHDVGFSLQGPFELKAAKGALPTARLSYTQLAGPKERNSVFISTGDRAFVEVGQTAYQLAPDQTASLRQQGESQSLQGLHLEKWARAPKVSDGGTADGVAAQRIDADVDVVPALNDIFGLAGQFGADQTGVKKIDGPSADQLRKAVQSAKLVILTGKKDRLMRSLQLDVTFAAQSVSQLQSALGQLAGVRLDVLLTIAGPNQPVHVEPPAAPRPISELSGR
ncbi:MAG: hypothetical protein QOG64_2169 [Acidimicrobiaceae bacterium]|nr:hypothetical protein [Acidimicrobiaceae bacterium]